jgi:serine/threonine-protein kinase
MFCIHCRSEIEAKFKACPFCGEAISDFHRRYADAPIDGKYQLLARLGVGGMGEVYKALHVHLNSIRVIKVMRPQLNAEAGAHDRFLREARLATRIQHPNVATLFDFSTLDDGSRYMVWEYIEGINLHEMLEQRGPLSPRYASKIAVQALQGLDAIHRAGIVHRDVSPENIMVARADDGEERVKIIDLGIAKAGVDGDDKTKTGMFVGKWKYCSPEHLGMLNETERIDGRADLYSFGIVLYEMLSGVPPFQADTPHSYLLMHASERPKALREMNPTIPESPELEALIFRALEKDRKDRFASAREFAQAIEKLMPSLTDAAGRYEALPPGADVTMPATRSVDTPTVATPSDELATVVTAVESAPQKKARTGVIAAVAAAIAAAIGIPMWRSHSTAPASSTPAVQSSVLATSPAVPPPSTVTVEAPAPAAPVAIAPKQGRLGITAYPWAEVTRIRNVKSGDEVPLKESLVTPVPIDLAPGKYELTFSNPAFGKPIRKTVTITANQQQFVYVAFDDPQSASLPALDEGSE